MDRRATWVFALLLLGCSARPLAADTGEGQTATTGSSTGEGESTGGESTEVGGSTGDESTDTSAGGECGDGVVDPGEACDLGPANAWEHADCQPDCTFNECGDGYVGPGEVCDSRLCSPDCQIPALACRNAIYACGNGIDDDGDGLVDLHDPDCLSPCDDAEDAYWARLPGTGGAGGCDYDCAYDANTGRGDDHCRWRPQCDPLDPGALIGCAYDPNYQLCQTLAVAQEPECIDRCVPITANGCDCFGCCEIGGVFRQPEYGDCSAADPESCPACTPHPQCFNPCEPEACEVCFDGALAPECEAPSCPVGVEACTDPYGCGDGEFCQTGCCKPIAPEW